MKKVKKKKTRRKSEKRETRGQCTINQSPPTTLVVVVGRVLFLLSFDGLETINIYIGLSLNDVDAAAVAGNVSSIISTNRAVEM